MRTCRNFSHSNRSVARDSSVLGPVVCSFSNRATSNPADGHYYWMYKTLFDYQSQRGESAGFTIGPTGQHGSHLRPTLRARFAGLEFQVTPMSLITYPWRSIVASTKNAIENGATHIQFYDGGLMELFVARRVAARFPSLTVIFNFHWAEHWFDILTGRGKVRENLSAKVAKLCVLSPANLVFSAETSVFADFLHSRIGIKVETYPIASNLDPVPPKEWWLRETDILFLPQRSSEIRDVHALANALDGLGLNIKTVAKNREILSTQLLTPAGDVVIGTMSSEKYSRTLRDARVVVLPYDKPYFRWGSSGKFNEAIACGAFPFVPEWTAIASQSSGLEEDHWLDFHNIQAAAQKILSRVRAGMPENLRALQIEDFFEWASSVHSSISVSGRQPRSGSHTVIAFLLACLYRTNPRLTRARIRSELGKIFDTIRASVG